MASPQFPLPIEADQALMDLGARLALRRRLMSMTQSDLAQQAGVGVSSIVALERGGQGVAIGTLARVLWVFGQTADLHDLGALEQGDPLLETRLDTVPQRIRTKRT